MSASEKAAVREAWASYLCPDRPLLWQWACSMLPPDALWGFSHLHPTTLFPDLYPHQRPPGLEMLPPLDAEGGLGPDECLAEEADEPSAQQQPPQEPCAGSAADPPSSLESDAELLSGSSSACCCSGCIGDSSGWCDSSPDSQLVQPGKRIKWSGAIVTSDPVRRNLFPALQRQWAAGAAAPGPCAQPAAPAVAPPANPAAVHTAAPPKPTAEGQPAAAALVLPAVRRSRRLQHASVA
jgi:hypothetical protein